MDDKKDIIIMVDDDATNLTVGVSSLSERYDVFTAPSGKKLFALLDKVKPSLILLDIEMPEMDGYEVIKQLKLSKNTEYIPVIFLTAHIDPENEVKGLELGAVDYITKPFSRELLIKRIDLHIQFEKQKKELLNYSLNLESEVDKKTKAFIELQNAMLKTIAELVERRDNVTGGHIERTQRYLRLLMEFLLEHNAYVDELSSWDVDLFIMSSQLHDVGKISIRDDILTKPGTLTNEEFEDMKKHALIGVDIIKSIESITHDNEFLKYAEILAGTHHEKWNGKGYPYGLKEYDIPLHGRLMAIVDVYDALTQERPYKKAFSHEDSADIIRKEKAEHFDPVITDVFLMHEKEFKSAATKKTYGESSANPRRLRSVSSALRVVSNIFDLRGGADGGYTEDIRRYLKIFIDALSKRDEYKEEVSNWDVDVFLLSAQLHDIGKIAVNSDILNKSEKLTKDEFENIKAHTDFGMQIINRIKDNVDNGNLLYHAEAFAGTHHEKWDGTGYPLGLKGEEIPLQGRIMAIVDVYGALVSDRPHRGKIAHKNAVEIIRNCGGTHFDPALVDIFLEYEKSFEETQK